MTGIDVYKRQIMESFMDKLSVRSVPGRGTTVSMRKKLASRLKAAK